MGRYLVLVKRSLCRLLIFLHLHSIDCERCSAFNECWGDDMRKRLEELRLAQSSGGAPSQPSGDKGNAA